MKMIYFDLFIVILFLTNYNCVTGFCETVLQPIKIFANMDKATFLDKININASYAVLNNDNAFCVKSKEDFFIQINFDELTRVKTLRIQGFVLDGRNLVLPGYSLEFSFDDTKWFIYNEQQNQLPKFFHHITRNGNSINENSIDAVGKYMRIKPRWPNGDNHPKEFCIRLQLVGCNTLPRPILLMPESVQSSLFLPIVLNCSTQGSVGLQLVWKGHSKSMAKQLSGKYLNGYSLSTDIFLNFGFGDLDEEFKCEKFSDYSICHRNFLCRSFYEYNRKERTQKNLDLSIVIKYPKLLKPLQVTKKDGNVLVHWQKPNLADFQEQMFVYNLKCNLTGRLFSKQLAISVTSYSFPNLGIYQPCECSLELILKNESRSHAFDIKENVVHLSFRSKSLRPNVTPRISMETVSPSQINVKFNTTFAMKEQGQLLGHRIDAVILEYGERSITQNIFKTIHFVKFANGSNLSETTLTNLHPWSLYNISVVAFNEDGLLTNVSYKEIQTLEGAPSIGPLLRTSITNDKSIVLEVDKRSFPRHKHNGVIKSIKILMSPGDIMQEFENNKIFEIFNLYPNTEYTFRACAATVDGYGPYGGVLTVSTLEGHPNEPTNLHVKMSKNKDEGLLVSWSRPSRPNGLITKYEIQLISKDGQAKSVLKAPNKTENVVINEGNVDAVSSVIIRAYTKTGYGDWSKQIRVMPLNNKSENENESKSYMSIALIIVISVVIIIIVILLFCYFTQHSLRRKGHRQFCVSDSSEKVPLKYMHEQSITETTCSNVIHVPMDESGSSLDAVKKRKSMNSDADKQPLLDNDESHDVIPKDQFLDFYNRSKQNDFEIFVEDFRCNLSSGRLYPCHVAEKPDNRLKNRYDNVLAYDHSRVILKFDCKRKTSDYINASMLQGYNYMADTTTRYISTQGPMQNTFNDFWHMIWQEKIANIVMVTNLQELDKMKCDQYWPGSGHIRYGSIDVTLDKIDKTADYVIRTFQIEKASTKEQRTVRHFHFVSWPDHGVPDYPTSLLSLRRRVRHYYDESSPLLVHCSAGIGRSGCFILVDAMLEQIDKENTVDVFNYLKYMRTRRFNMVQNLEQYIFAHNAIMEYILFGNTEIVIGELDRITREMIRGTGMVDEFALLNRNTDRSMTSNPYKVMLLEGRYVDAYHVDGYKLRNAFVLTKAPSERNTGDFWKMVLEQQCHTIVMLNRTQETSQDYFKYWPNIDAHAVHGDITVLMTSEVAHANIITRKIKVTSNKGKCELHMLQYMDWPEGNVPDRHGYTNICTLMQAVEKSQQTHGNNPIVVHAGNDYGRSGTFVAIYNSTERLKVEQLIDVLQCVRGIRIVQPNAVDNVTQYQFVYNILRTYLEAFENYWNYSDYKVCRSPLNSTSNT